MPKYRVELWSTTTKMFEVEVEAEDPGAAEEAALGRVATEDLDYRETGDSGEMEVQCVEEITPDDREDAA